MAAQPKVLPLAQSSGASRLMHLAPNFSIDVDEIIGEGIVGFGLKGSGKTNAGALLAEQFGKFSIPMVVFDLEGDYLSLVDVLPRGVIGSVTSFPTGRDVLERGLQVIYDLSSWPNDELAACSMMHVVTQLMRCSTDTPSHERVPCLVFLDEAAHFLPQKKANHFGEATRQALRDTFHTLSTRGRKRGLIPCLFTQRISELHKDVMSQAGMYFFMRQTLDVDLDRCMNYIQAPGDLTTKQVKARIASFPVGRALVKLPGGVQKSITFHKRESEHISHTPKSQAAINRYARLPFEAEMHFEAYSPEQQAAEEPKKPQERVPSPEEKKRSGKPKHAPTIQQRVFALLEKEPALTSRQLSALIGCPQNTVQIARKAYFAQTPKIGVQESRITALLAENPDYTVAQLSRLGSMPYKDVKKVLARILIRSSASLELPASL